MCRTSPLALTYTVGATVEPDPAAELAFKLASTDERPGAGKRPDGIYGPGIFAYVGPNALAHAERLIQAIDRTGRGPARIVELSFNDPADVYVTYPAGACAGYAAAPSSPRCGT